MAESRTDRWTADIIAACLGVVLGGVVAFIFAPQLVDFQKPVTSGTYAVVLGACLLTFLGGHYDGFPLRRPVQFLAGAVWALALLGIITSTM